MILSTDPRSGESVATHIAPTSAVEVDERVQAAVQAQEFLGALSRTDRAALLDSIAQSIEHDRASLVTIAMSETGLSEVRLDGEVSRTVFQFQLFAEAVREGSFLEIAIDHAADTPLGPGPDIRRMLIPIGPVAVFGSSNFPFAFSVPGGDTASAIAAGNPVITKAHSAHPLTSQAAYEAIRRAFQSINAPEGAFAIVYGQDAGAELVAHPGVCAVGFTGSLATGKRLQEIIDEREQPIPLYGELSSLNPLIISENALVERRAEIAQGLAQSVIASAGQLCTKPGFAFVPSGAAGDEFLAEVAQIFAESSATTLLNNRVFDAFEAARSHLLEQPEISQLAAGVQPEGNGFTVAPTILSIPAVEMTAEHTEEAFGPLIVAVRYETVNEVAEALEAIPPSLTATLHHGASDADLLTFFMEHLPQRSGRLVFNGFPTGVRVCWAQHHGGPWPSTNTLHTSVGVTAMRRFLRPLAFQNAPEDVLPPELRDSYTDCPRRIDGKLIVPAE